MQQVDRVAGKGSGRWGFFYGGSSLSIFSRASFGDSKRGGAAGFTLLEMMIVLGMVLVLSSATMVYNRGIGRQIIIAREHAKVLGLLIKARSAGFTNPGVDAGQPVCGYGIYADPASPRTFVFFKDLCAFANRAYDPGEEIERIVLDPSVEVTSTADNIVFIPPFGKVVIDNDVAIVAATTTVHSASAGMTRHIKINAYGQITE